MRDGPRGFTPGFTCPVLLRVPVGCSTVSHTGLSPSVAGLSRPLRYRRILHVLALQPREDKSPRFGLFRFRSPLLTESILFIFLRLLRCFTSAGVAQPFLCVRKGVTQRYLRRVAPFGNLRVLMRICRSPKLIAAYHVLLRLTMPRHPLIALSNLAAVYILDACITYYNYKVNFEIRLSKNGKLSLRLSAFT